MLGKLKLPLPFGRYFEITGGPYAEAPDTMVGVKMAREINFEADVSIPTIDFKTPPPELLADGLTKAVELLVEGEPLYVGCMGGKGRTGLFLSVLAKAWGIPNPVEYVRENYYNHAVETKEQYKFVTEFPIPTEVTRAIQSAKFWSFFRFRFNLTNAAKSW
jgi:hypothetical protein